MGIEQIRRLAGREEIDYPLLLALLKDYSHPRDKISDWLRKGDLIRVKKGLYVFSKEISLRPYSIELLANLIYGPSAISLHYALSYYGIIPERVFTVTSITHKRHKRFSTPIGEFSYTYLSPTKYPVGIDLININQQSSFLMASREKALADVVSLSGKNLSLTNLAEVKSYLFDDLRCDIQQLHRFKLTRMQELATVYQNKNYSQLVKFFKKACAYE